MSRSGSSTISHRPRRALGRLPRRLASLAVVIGGAASLALAMIVPAQAVPRQAAAPGATAATHMTIDCGSEYGWSAVQCPDVYNPKAAFGHYVGHDEPGVWFDSNRPGSGNRARWLLTIPKDPPPSSVFGADSYSFENHIAFWFGMALCASQSYPEQLSTCTPDSDSNIVNPKVSAAHTGSAYLELQFYPPGWAAMPSGISCDATQWCAAMNVWSYYFNPVTGQYLNTACQAQVGGVELDNFAFVSRNGRPTGPPDPLHATTATFTPNGDTLMMNQGDKVAVTIENTRQGLTTRLVDVTSHRTGFMTASARNGFAQMVFATDPSTTCTSTPYTFRPMYSTSSLQTRATWTAFPYNVAYSDETGHFDYCSQVDTSTGSCTGLEGPPGDQEPADVDDTYCFAPSQSSLDPVGGCAAANYGFDGTSYQDDWPNGQPNRPTPVMFTSALTGRRFDINYQRVALAAPLPFNEEGGGNQPCNINTRTGCTHIPVTDDGTPAPFYPYFFTTRVNGCTWGEGQDIPGLTVNDFGKQNQYGGYDMGVYYTGTGGTAQSFSTVFLHTFRDNVCPANARHRHRRH